MLNDSDDETLLQYQAKRPMQSRLKVLYKNPLLRCLFASLTPIIITIILYVIVNNSLSSMELKIGILNDRSKKASDSVSGLLGQVQEIIGKLDQIDVVKIEADLKRMEELNKLMGDELDILNKTFISYEANISKMLVQIQSLNLTVFDDLAIFQANLLDSLGTVSNKVQFLNESFSSSLGIITDKLSLLDVKMELESSYRIGNDSLISNESFKNDTKINKTINLLNTRLTEMISENSKNDIEIKDELKILSNKLNDIKVSSNNNDTKIRKSVSLLLNSLNNEVKNRKAEDLKLDHSLSEISVKLTGAIRSSYVNDTRIENRIGKLNVECKYSKPKLNSYFYCNDAALSTGEYYLNHVSEGKYEVQSATGSQYPKGWILCCGVG